MLSNIPLHVTDLEFVDEQNSNGLMLLFFVTLLSVDLNGFNAFLQALPSLKDWVVYFCKTLNEMTLLHDHHCTMVTSSSSCSCGSAAYSKFWSGYSDLKKCVC